MIIYQVDAFTSEPFAGNPAAVCILENDMPDAWKQNVASEMNLSETAFALPESEGFLLRWFTPQTEVSLCGHATLATAHILWQQGIVSSSQQAHFRTLRSGLLSAVKRENWIAMDFPAIVTEETQALPGLEEGLGAKPVRCHIHHEKKGDTHLVELESEETVRNLRPDLAALQKAGAGVVLVTARSESQEFDFVSRFFAPAIGIDEDPVTGFAHCCLVPYWSKIMGKRSFTAFQASNRGGIVRCELRDERVMLCGQAKTIFKAELFV